MSLKKYKEHNRYIIPYEDNSYIDFVVLSKDNNRLYLFIQIKK